MKFDAQDLAPGLYLVATPIGSARDITLRALDVLASADILVAEDTRTLRRLLQIHGVPVGERQVLSYHDHNGTRMRPRLMALLAEGRSVAYASEAGTPLVADPGFQLAREARDAGHLVTSAPGPSAVVTALSIAGLPTDRFLFAGFPPSGAGERRRWLKEVCAVPATIAIYEAPGRVYRILAELCEVCGKEREAAICRELTKRFEEVLTGTVADLAAALDGKKLKGEVVLLLDRDRRTASDSDLDAALTEAMKAMTVKDAAAVVAADLGLPKRMVYQAALKRAKET